MIEIASPGTRAHDRTTQLNVSARGSVPEVWLAEPADQTIEVLALEAGAYRTLGVFTAASLLPFRILPELPVRVEQFFA